MNYISSDNSSKTDDRPLMSMTEFAQRLGISKRTLQRLRQAGMLPAPIRFRGSLRWDPNTIANWIQQGCPDMCTVEQTSDIIDKGEFS